MKLITPEGKVKAKVKEILKQYGCYQYWPVSNGMGAPALDCIGCCKGRFFSIECKAPGKSPTIRQLGTMQNIQAANGMVFMQDGSEAMTALLTLWLDRLTK